MSRHGYSDDCDNWALIRWRGAVSAGVRGHRGQAALRELLAALDAMPVKELAPESFGTAADGEFCALGVLANARGVDMSSIDPEDSRNQVAEALDISPAMAAEVMFENDDCRPFGTIDRARSARWSYMRQWVVSNIIIEPLGATTGGKNGI